MGLWFESVKENFGRQPKLQSSTKNILQGVVSDQTSLGKFPPLCVPDALNSNTLLIYYFEIILAKLLSRFSLVRLCVTPWMAAHQAPPFLGFSRQEHWLGCHFLLQCVKVKSESEVAQSCPTLRNPTDCSLPGSSVHGIFQARVLEWGAIAFSQSSTYLPH